MRKVVGVILVVVTAGFIFLLNSPLGSLPALGRLIDPINGCWANADPIKDCINNSQQWPGLQHEATVWIDTMMVPHIHAANDHDVFFIEGYIHAQNRLWQMDMETRAAAGRVSEVAGPKARDYDRKQRRKGMGYAAESSLRAMEAEPRTRLMMDAYTEGINKYIATLCYRNYPLEYKLMGFAPEQWTNLKTALLMKYMADDLTGGTDDMALTYLRDILPADELKLLFPDKIAGSDPVIPRGTTFDKPSLPMPDAPPDSVAFSHYKPTDFGEQRVDGKGSNNWALSGSRTASGAAILCNDPHLVLNLPSLWYAIQLQTPDMNVYGASLPGAPGVIIGFNDSLTWGLTNNYRDVKDFYEIKRVQDNSSKYWFAGKQVDFTKRIEHILIKGQPEVVDTVYYTLHGPLMYDNKYTSTDGLQKDIAICWMGHRSTNEVLAVYLLNRAKNYDQYVDAILNFQCPAQNFAYADRQGNIAIWGQGLFVNKWKDQGTYVMNGFDSSTLWGQLIPMRENPHALNPPQGFIASANESVTDDTYPYWYNGSFVELRAWRINQLLSGMHKATVQDMFAMQNDTYSPLAAGTLPIMLKYVQNEANGRYTEGLKTWNYRLSADSREAAIFQVWWYFFSKDLCRHVLGNKVPDHFAPLQERIMQLMQAHIFPGINDTVKADENYRQLALKSFTEMQDSLGRFMSSGRKDITWSELKNTSVAHLAKLAPFSFDHLKIGGWGNTINAAKGDHGPSWRMIVQMGKDEIEAYGVYPGGQSGNPGSAHYDDMLQHWVDGKYYRLLFLPNANEQNNNAISYVLKIKP